MGIVEALAFGDASASSVAIGVENFMVKQPILETSERRNGS